jgi:pSer/pThr/pTyr-binding forkhead associated (FHA) protein
VHVQPVAESRPARAKPALIVRDPGGSGLSAGTVFPITAAVTIGRAKDNSIRISDRFASGHHAIIFLKNDRRILRDRGSTNGTARNGKRVADEVALSNGDLIGVGTVVLEYRSDGTR